MTKFSLKPRSFPLELSKGHIQITEDTLEKEHWQFVVNHPDFQPDLDVLREERENVLDRHGLTELQELMLEDPGFDWPFLNKLSDKWGVPPSALVVFATISLSKIAELRPEAIEEIRREAHGIVVHETDCEFIVRIPRPITNAKKEALGRWLRSLPNSGPREVAWDRDGKQREDLSPSLMEAIPWFTRWNCESEEPTSIWRELTKPGGEHEPADLNDQQVYDRLVGVWKRMRKLSLTGIRDDRPSKKPS